MTYDSEEKKAEEALRREKERIEEENRRKDKDKADLLKKIQCQCVSRCVYFREKQNG